ncbi:MAG: sel1 repeat family protein [Muribaculaceae bacterium]|nr:sel1 repeat family protein [Muribaculaceae bacterium]
MIGLTASAEITASDIFQKGLDFAQKGQYEQAAKYFQRAAEQGDAFAQCNLGSYYESRTGVSNTLLVPISNNTILPFASSMIFDGFTSRCNIFVDLIDCGDNSGLLHDLSHLAQNHKPPY